MSPTVLVVDDDVRMCEWIARSLSHRGVAVTWKTDGDEALAALDSAAWDCVVTDLKMRGVDGLELCERIVRDTALPVITITGFGSMEAAVAAMRAGAYDFLTKPFDIEELHFAVQRAAQLKRLTDEVRRLRRVVDDDGASDGILGKSAAVSRLRRLIARLADSDASVLVSGESGTGKELVARALHAAGPNHAGAFVPVNCAAMPDALLESELFGHARGAFTDARESRPGLFLLAQRGTLFLDEIGELPLALQPKLLRALQERRFRPVGSDREIPFEGRLIAATNRDLAAEVEEGRFREDLFFRINVLEVEVPPLRARGSDVLLLAQNFADRIADRAGRPRLQMAPAAAERLLGYPWPGNVRELQNCMERAVLLSTSDRIHAEGFPDAIRLYQRSHVLVAATDPSELVPLDEVESRYIARVLEAVGGNKARAARILGLDRKTLYRKLERRRSDEAPPARRRAVGA